MGLTAFFVYKENTSDLPALYIPIFLIRRNRKNALQVNGKFSTIGCDNLQSLFKAMMKGDTDSGLLREI